MRLFFKLSQRLNALSTPFIADDGTGEDDYALLPPPRQLGLLQLMAITFFAVSGSAYGIEETVSAGGPLLALSALAGAALCWSAPLAMVSAELCANARRGFERTLCLPCADCASAGCAQLVRDAAQWRVHRMGAQRLRAARLAPQWHGQLAV